MAIRSHETPVFPRPPESIKLVNSFEELASTPFQGRVNAFCWPRVLDGDFAEVVKTLGPGEGITSLDDSILKNLRVSLSGRLAINKMLEDKLLLANLALDPVLNCIYAYSPDEDASPVRTDVFSFHVDSAPVEAETWLCTYHGAPSEGLCNEEAIRRIDIPSTRAELLQIHGGPDDEKFDLFLSENCYDLHYAPLPGAIPYSFGVGNLWRISIAYPGSPVLPCIHRAPRSGITDPPRLLLIS